jgi:hypothetical protein
MSTESFHRHTRRRVDAATRHVFTSLASRPAVRGAFARLRVLASERSDLLRALPPRLGAYPPLEALRNLAGFHRDITGDPATCPGATGHPLRVVDSLARHLLGRYPGPRFLASVWFGAGSARERVRREWFVAQARGRPLRTLALPIVMTRRMRHVFLGTPDHLSLDHGFRRAEVIGLGGDPTLAAAVIATRLGHDFAHRAFWRGVIEWLVACGDDLDLAQVRPFVEYAHGSRLSLRGRSYASVVQAAAMWPPRPAPAVPSPWLRWPRSRWSELVHSDEDARWRLVELLDSIQLFDEGRAMRHCVASYAARCARGDSTIWSLRCDERSVLTIEVEPRAATIVQVRGVANARTVDARPRELLRHWAARERLGFAESVRLELGG